MKSELLVLILLAGILPTYLLLFRKFLGKRLERWLYDASLFLTGSKR